MQKKVIVLSSLLLQIVLVSCYITSDGLKSYDKYSVPKESQNSSVLVKLDMNLLSIAHINLKDQTVLVKINIEISWRDIYLVSSLNWTIGNNWTKSLDSKHIWVPDLMITTYGAYGLRLKSDNYGNVIVRRDGEIKAWIPVQVELSIDAKITHYPFDVQTVNVYFLPWTLPIEDIRLVLPPGAQPYRYYKANGEWDVLSHVISEFNTEFDNLTYTNILYTFTVQRQSLFLVLSIVIPVVLTSSLNILVHILPAQGGDRLTLSVTVFLTLAVFLSIVDQSLPKTSRGVSIFVVYLGLQLLSSALTIVSACLVLNISDQRENVQPGRVYRFLSKLCCVHVSNGCGGIMHHKHVYSVSKERNKVRNDLDAKDISNNKTCLLLRRFDSVLFWLSMTWNAMLITMMIMAAYLA
ncbi:Acetylcholine-activated cation-selective channel [Mactra antiquata]